MYKRQSQYWYYYLRSPYASDSYHVRSVRSDGTLDGDIAYVGYYGVRPALNLSSSILVSDSPAPVSSAERWLTPWAISGDCG